MSPQRVANWLAEHAPDLRVIDNGCETATVADAAAALQVDAARIAKTLALRVSDRVLLVVTRGDARLDNGKCKAVLGGRPRMLDPAETLERTGHPVGGVCPFGLATDLPVYCDISLRGYQTVYPAAGSRTTSIEVAPERLAILLSSEWVDICTVSEG
jgi:prolyl-tRNA editing enzyme YbaK/EbsC (Cys-tRNA(Pro) deacylase)